MLECWRDFSINHKQFLLESITASEQFLGNFSEKLELLSCHYTITKTSRLYRMRLLWGWILAAISWQGSEGCGLHYQQMQGEEIRWHAPRTSKIPTNEPVKGNDSLEDAAMSVSKGCESLSFLTCWCSNRFFSAGYWIIFCAICTCIASGATNRKAILYHVQKQVISSWKDLDAC